MRITEVLAAIQPMSVADYASHAQQRDAQQRQAVAARRAELKAKQQAAQQAQVARTKQQQARKATLKFGRKRRKKSRRA
jgi:hypothetical protein